MSKRDFDNALAVFKREFLAYFNSPVLYVIVVIFLLASMGFAFFFGRFLDTDNASLTQPFFFWHPWIYVVLAPAVGMRLWSEAPPRHLRTPDDHAAFAMERHRRKVPRRRGRVVHRSAADLPDCPDRELPW
jgi:hypothetical protein